MTPELKEIKKKYGEEMAYFCREHFATLLETEGLLSSLLLEHFDPNHELYKDLKENNLLSGFVQYIDSFMGKKEELVDRKETPKELLAKAGYDLYKCKTESDIQSFKKYYAKGEELCTFHGGRLKTNYVFFAVKKNVDTIKRENFEYPKRQDAYGTSVISIQFDRNSNQVSIKNRYNHTVVNPDSTFGNNLDNIIEGLTKSFERVYGFKQKYVPTFEIPNYVMRNGKYYKYNYEIDNSYYCTNNIFIKRDEVISYEKERYILFDYYLLDMKEKKIIDLYEGYYINDSFIETIGHIQKIEIEKEKNNKKIRMENAFGEQIEIVINSSNQMVSYTNRDIQKINDSFCRKNHFLQELDLPNVQTIGNDFCLLNESIEHLNLPNVQTIGNDFLYHNKSLVKLDLPMVKEIGSSFCAYNDRLKYILLPKVKTIKYAFLIYNQSLIELDLPNVEWIGNDFCNSNTNLKKINLPKVKTIESYFCYLNNSIEHLSLPKVKTIGTDFFHYNQSLSSFYAPNLKKVGTEFLAINFCLKSLIIPKLENTENIIKLLNRKMSLDVLVLNDELMNSNYPLVLSYKKKFLLKEKRRKIFLFMKRIEETCKYVRR